MEVVSTIMAATSTLAMATGTLHASVHSVYECKVVEGRVQAGEVAVSLMWADWRGRRNGNEGVKGLQWRWSPPSWQLLAPLQWPQACSMHLCTASMSGRWSREGWKQVKQVPA